ncbi:MAG: hypothetical protein GC204_16410 [Chloroflexi bacterium]|nr:hypothetical protein [Chloroflexota bacterium]
MRGDFSRQTFERTKHYSAVLMQQGRVQLDADWNEQQNITEQRIETVTVDAIGISGAPNYAPGFEIKADPTGMKLLIGQGRFYLDGFLCENEEEVAYEQQPDLIEPPALADLLTQAGTKTAIVYLDVWQRHITALDDPHILEPALGGPDTTTRVKTVWQVKILPVQVATGDQIRATATLRRFQLDLTAYIADLVSHGGGQRRSDGTSPEGDLQVWETRLQNVTPAAGTPFAGNQARVLYYDLGQLRSTLNKVSGEVGVSATVILSALSRLETDLGGIVNEANCHSDFDEWLQMIDPSVATMTPDYNRIGASPEPCEIPSQVGASGTENQLYRVEIHKAGELTDPAGTSPTFKWSRDNGTVTFGIERISGRQVTVTSLGLDETMSLARDQWVEIIDDRLELAGQPGQLVQIDTPPDPTTLVMTMKDNVTVLASGADGVEPTRHPKIRRWDQSGNAQGLTTSLTPTPLESGITAKFSTGNYKTGDYWLLPARSNGRIDWPPFESPAVSRIPLPPMGIEHHYSRLALVEVDDTGKLSVSDCRRIFAPLAAPAMRVVATNWENDLEFSLTRLLDEGLLIWFDADPSSWSLNPGSTIVTLELPIAESQRSNTELQRNYSALSVILKGKIRVVGNNLHWAPEFESLRSLFHQLDVHASLSGMRMRVTLKGHVIHSDQHVSVLHLDGQVFGQVQKPPSGSQIPPIALTFPSGSGARASDFESWFYLIDDSYGYGYGYDSIFRSIGGDLI